MTSAVVPPSSLQKLKNASRYALYSVLRIISMFISSKSCSLMQSTKNGAETNNIKLHLWLLIQIQILDRVYFMYFRDTHHKNPCCHSTKRFITEACTGTSFSAVRPDSLQPNLWSSHLCLKSQMCSVFTKFSYLPLAVTYTTTLIQRPMLIIWHVLASKIPKENVLHKG